LKWKESFGKQGKAPGEFNQPGDVAVASNGMLYVADTWNGRIQVLTAHGVPAMQSAQSFFGPRGIAMAPDGTVFIMDTGNKRVVRLNPLLLQEIQWGAVGSGPGQFNEAVGITVSPKGEIWVADSGNRRVQAFDRNGKWKREFAVDGFQPVVYSEPHLAVDAKNRVWVTCPAVQEVRLYTSEGKLLKTWKGGPGALFEKPMGLALLPGGGAVVSDLTGRLAKIPAEP
jgi:DNA-binding beta-propeller fold protein YncE